jgi:hypothetical protein
VVSLVVMNSSLCRFFDEVAPTKRNRSEDASVDERSPALRSCESALRNLARILSVERIGEALNSFSPLFTGFALFLTSLGVFAQAPFIVSQPESQQVSAGATVSLNVEVTGSEPFSYSWMKNGRGVAGGTSKALIFKSAAVANTGSYMVTVRNSAGILMSQIARLEVNNLSATVRPIPVNGWNEDVVLEDSPVPLITDDFNGAGASWIEAGFFDHLDGLPASGRFTSQANTNVMFQFQPYTRNNVLRMNGPREIPATGSLTLVTPAPYNSLAILAAASGPEGLSGTFMMHFSDGTVASNITYIARSWNLGDSPNLAIAGLGHFQAGEFPNGYQHQGAGFGMFETDINLVSRQLNRKFLTSLTFTKPRDPAVVGIFALSGEANKTPVLDLKSLSAGSTEITVSGFPQTSYRIDVSSNLVAWSPLLAIAGTNGISSFIRPATNSVSRFYRAIVP